MTSNRKKSMLTGDTLRQAILDSFVKLNPMTMMKKPVMFVVEVGTVIVLLMTVLPGYFDSEDRIGFNFAVFLILLFTVLFANFAEALAEGRGKAQADSLKKTKQEVTAKKITDTGIKVVKSTELRKGDTVIVSQGELIPCDGEVIEGLASVDESAITGESAPVIKEAGGDFSSVTGGTRVVSDSIKVRVISDPGESFIDRMIALVEGAKRQKTPNEIALNTLLTSLTLIFLIVVVTLGPIAKFVDINLEVPVLIALLVCLIPTTIGGLLSAIGIAGMDRVTQYNVLAMSGKAVEAAGDINTMILDKTGTITFGNRMASELVAVGGHGSSTALAGWAAIGSLMDETPEGRSVIEFMKRHGLNYDAKLADNGEFIPFKAETRMSGIDLKDGRKVRKGAVDAVRNWVFAQGGTVPEDLTDKANVIASAGGTPLAVAVDKQIFGLIYLKDTVKPGMRERFEQLRQMGIKTIMCTGDNPLTAATIAKEAGVDDYIAESTPEDKIAVIRREQAEGKLVAMTGDGTNDAPALAQADVGIAMNSGTIAAKEAANMVDLDSDPSKIIEVVAIGKQLLMTRGALTTFSISNDIAKYFAIIPAMFMAVIPEMNVLNVMKLGSPYSAILSALIFNAIIIPLLIPLAMKGIKYKPMSAQKLLSRNLLIYGLGGVAAPFVGIKLIDLLVHLWV
ncbi:potassium-transporting ATPase subunit KdpB [Paenibacillus sp. NEAU-GSW1]|uniref:potassium-transporting ATPase subunit KdpB n=1 Tax=Paenibacillus sp. NEAU-GSW1 TaxID=2682486 RepID=UPI0012E29D91|nr:potassium-transporting ATPase subunit KdpB [Paenibacillus sp. NEAU-GSW1]MUT67144.1 potassium-transporting ATPase subunit KdpB [Paenibacillus sp. NEAU-GSW1]